MFTEEKKNSQISQDSDNVYKPADEIETSNFIKEIYKKNLPTEIVGTNTKNFIGNKLQCAKVLDLSRLSGIVEYLPEELYIKVKACTPISLIEESLEKNNQQLAFEPIDFGFLFLGKSNCGTAAGQVACNISGPRRFKVGSTRDHILGFRAVNGRGEIIKSGGTVVKNVTGYDLSKLICNSFGTLAVLTEITFKVLPSSEESKTLVIHNLKMDSASEYLEKAISSSNEVSGASFLPIEPICKNCEMNIENTFKLNDLKYGGSFTAFRIEGLKQSIIERLDNLKKELKVQELDISVLENLQSEIFWNKIKNLEFFSATKNNILRIVIPPSECINLIYELPSNFKYFLDWGGAVIWVEACEISEKKFESIRKRVIKHKGHIAMIKYSDHLPYVEDVFTINSIRFNISQNIKKSFDPKRILNPGKMYTGI